MEYVPHFCTFEPFGRSATLLTMGWLHMHHEEPVDLKVFPFDSTLQFISGLRIKELSIVELLEWVAPIEQAELREIDHHLALTRLAMDRINFQSG